MGGTGPQGHTARCSPCMSLCMELPGSQEALESPPLDMERGKLSPLLGVSREAAAAGGRGWRHGLGVGCGHQRHGMRWNASIAEYGVEDSQGLQWGQRLCSPLSLAPWPEAASPHLTRSTGAPFSCSPPLRSPDTGSQPVSGSEGSSVEPPTGSHSCAVTDGVFLGTWS